MENTTVNVKSIIFIICISIKILKFSVFINILINIFYWHIKRSKISNFDVSYIVSNHSSSSASLESRTLVSQSVSEARTTWGKVSHYIEE